MTTKVQKWLNDAIEEISKIHSETKWVVDGNGSWKVYDDFGNFLGIVNSSICVDTGDIKFRYRHDLTTYTNIDRVGKVTLSVPNLTDPQELNKLKEFDAKIVAAHKLKETE